MYTKETLIAENELYNAEHSVNERDVNMANIYKMIIETGRSPRYPKVGDVFYGKNGKRYHIDSTDNDHISQSVVIVENAYTPFLRAHVADSTIKLSLSTSGGPFTDAQAANMEHVQGETEEKRFCFFGHSGAVGNGAIDIKARVTVWREL